MIRKILFYIIVSLSFLGFYAVLLTMANLNQLEFSRSLTVPMRVVIVLSLILLFFTSRKKKITFGSILFLVFASLYVLRVFLDIIQNRYYYMPFEEVLFYFLSFSVLPFIILKHIVVDRHLLELIRKAFLHSSFIFSVLATIFYWKYVGTVGRLTSGTSEDEIISPLILSYCSALTIGICLNMLITLKRNIRQRIFLIALIGLSLTPFFLGASRGSIIALVIPFIFILLTNKNIINSFRIGLLFVVVFFSMIFFSEKFESGVFDRLFNLTTDIERGNSSALRVQIWDQALEQFSNNPVFGDKLEVNGFPIYPHNLFIEVLLTTGLLGFIPFFALVILALKECFYIFRDFRSFSWIAVVFLQSFTQNMFSGSVATASWFWFSMALVLSLRQILISASPMQSPKFTRQIISI